MMLHNIKVKRKNNLLVVGFASMLSILVFLTLNCAGFLETEKPSGQNDDQAHKPETALLEPSTTPEGTVKALYGDTTFFNLRNEIPPAVIEHLSPCITTNLKTHFERHNRDIDAWMARNKDADLKLPISEGPIFLSNYEGADSYQVGKANIDGKIAKVPVSLSITDAMGTYQWVDIVFLRRVGNVWLLDNIKFQAGGGDSYTLLDRIALVE